MSVRTVTKVNAELKAAGLILMERHYNKLRKGHESSTYTLCALGVPRSGNRCTTPREKERRDNLPTFKGNSTL